MKLNDFHTGEQQTGKTLANRELRSTSTWLSGGSSPEIETAIIPFNYTSSSGVWRTQK
jgi:hypothetical protein